MPDTAPIPGVSVLHQRSEWERVGQRMATDFTRQPPAIVMRDVTRMAEHYTGGTSLPTGDPGETTAQIATVLAAAQNDYLTTRDDGPYVQKSIYGGRTFPGYPLGYNFGIDWTGGVWVIRGWEFRPAATNGHNTYTVACLFFVDGPDNATPAQWASFRAIGRETRRRAQIAGQPGGRFDPHSWDHGTFYLNTRIGTPTACAGAGIRAATPTQGYIDLDGSPNPGGSNMLIVPDVRMLDTRSMAWGGGGPRKVPGGSEVLIMVPGSGPSARPAWAGAAVVRIGCIEPVGPGFATAWSGVGTRPSTSTDVNWLNNTGEVDWAFPRLNGFTFSVFVTTTCHLTVNLRGYAEAV